MGRAELKEVKARSREVNSAMRAAAASAGTPSSGVLQITPLLVELITGLATLSAMVEALADHILATEEPDTG